MVDGIDWSHAFHMDGTNHFYACQSEVSTVYREWQFNITVDIGRFGT